MREYKKRARERAKAKREGDKGRIEVDMEGCCWMDRDDEREWVWDGADRWTDQTEGAPGDLGEV